MSLDDERNSVRVGPGVMAIEQDVRARIGTITAAAIRMGESVEHCPSFRAAVLS
jgi:hypothetical protein